MKKEEQEQKTEQTVDEKKRTKRKSRLYLSLAGLFAFSTAALFIKNRKMCKDFYILQGKHQNLETVCRGQGKTIEKLNYNLGKLNNYE